MTLQRAGLPGSQIAELQILIRSIKQELPFSQQAFQKFVVQVTSRAAEAVKGSFEIHTPRLVLRTATHSDVKTYHKQRTAPENHAFGGTEDNGSLEKTQATVEKLIEKTAQGGTAF